MDPLVYQRCTTSDLGRLQALSISTFTHAFAAQNNPDDFNRYLGEAFSAERLLRELEHPEMQFYFVYSGDLLVGYFKLNAGQAQTELQEETGMEIERIYVREPWQGKGIGAHMISWVRRHALSLGKTYIWLGVWEHNPRAIDFYQRLGFVTFGKHHYDIGNDRQWDWLMRLELNPGTG